VDLSAWEWQALGETLSYCLFNNVVVWENSWWHW